MSEPPIKAEFGSPTVCYVDGCDAGDIQSVKMMLIGPAGECLTTLWCCPGHADTAEAEMSAGLANQFHSNFFTSAKRWRKE